MADPEYIGDVFPPWVKPGVRVKVKSTPVTRKHGFDMLFGSPDRAWPGEEGTIVRRDGNGWWSYAVEFPRGLTYSLSRDRLENLVRLPRKKGENPPPAV